MAISDEGLAAKVEVLRREYLDRVRTRVGESLPAEVISERMLKAVAHDLREEAVQAVWDHPDFPAVARSMARSSLPAMASDDVVTHALRDIGKLAAAVAALYLDATPGGLTHARFDAFCEVAGWGSRTWSYGVIAYLRFLGYIVPGGQTGDGRERRYRPTERMRNAFRAHFVALVRRLSPIQQRVAEFADRMEREDAAFDAYMAMAGEGALIAGLIHRLNTEPTLDVFARRRSGMVVLWTLLLSSPETDVWPPVEPFPISIAALARKAAVSRTHLLRLLREGEEAGMLALDGAGNVRILDFLRLEVNTLLALQVICFGAAARNAERRLAEQAAGYRIQPPSVSPAPV